MSKSMYITSTTKSLSVVGSPFSPVFCANEWGVCSQAQSKGWLRSTTNLKYSISGTIIVFHRICHMETIIF